MHVPYYLQELFYLCIILVQSLHKTKQTVIGCFTCHSIMWSLKLVSLVGEDEDCDTGTYGFVPLDG